MLTNLLLFVSAVLGFALMFSAIRYGSLRLMADELADVNEHLAEANLILRAENVALRADVDAHPHVRQTDTAVQAQFDKVVDEALALFDEGIGRFVGDVKPIEYPPAEADVINLDSARRGKLI